MKWELFPWMAMLAGATMLAQQSAPTYRFATIRASEDAEAKGGYNFVPGKLTLENQTLEDCVRIAYGMEVVRSPSAPKWTATQKFDIEVEAARSVDDKEMKGMLRSLLEHRFKLVAHRESKMVPGYALVVSKNGLKIHESEPGPGRISTRLGFMNGQAASMANLAQALSVVSKMPVIDKTALPGVFNFILEWRPDVVEPGALTAEEEEPTVLPNMPRGPSLVEAVEEQLGLKLQSLKAPLELLVIEQAERPGA